MDTRPWKTMTILGLTAVQTLPYKCYASHKFKGVRNDVEDTRKRPHEAEDIRHSEKGRDDTRTRAGIDCRNQDTKTWGRRYLETKTRGRRIFRNESTRTRGRRYPETKVRGRIYLETSTGGLRYLETRTWAHKVEPMIQKRGNDNTRDRSFITR